MRIPIFMILSFVMTIAAWAKKALEDGQITAEEAFDLVSQLAGHLGVPLAVDVPDKLKDQIATAAEIIEAVAEVAGPGAPGEPKPGRYSHF